MQRLSTGIKGLDVMLKGGLPKGSMTLLLGSPGTGKTTIGIQFLLEGIRYERPSVEVLTFPWENLRLIAEGFEWEQTEVSLLERVACFDLFSWRGGAKPSFDYASDPRKPSDVSIDLSKLLEANKVSSEANARLVMDSFSDIIQVNESGVAGRFLQGLKQRLAGLGVTTLVLLEQGVHDDQTVAQVEFACDGTIALRTKEEQRELSVTRMIATPAGPRWIPYSILSGIDVKAEAFFR